MLRGHESLIRTVGKRRRLAIDAVLQQGQREVDTVEETVQWQKTDEIVSENSRLLRLESVIIHTDASKAVSQEASQRHNETKKQDTCMEWVKCPVCGKAIKTSLINSHLDFCLLGGAKARNNQLSISHFCSVSAHGQTKTSEETESGLKKQHHLHRTSKAETRTVCLPSAFSSEIMVFAESSIQDVQLTVRKNLERDKFVSEEGGSKTFLDSLGVELQGSKLDGLPGQSAGQSFTELTKTSSLLYATCHCSCHTVMNSGMRMEDRENKKTERNGDGVLAKLLEKDIKGGEPNSASGDECELVGVLETKIVGRKFNQGARVEKGLKIAVLREPDNLKDPNAIKIVSTEDEGAIPLGHLPRELACHLSCLLDKGMLHVEGSILVVPEKAFEAVPLKLFCRKRSPVGILDVGFFEECWEKILHVAEKRGKQEIVEHSPDLTRYQQNFFYFVEAVLECESHLLSEEEKTFIGSFSLLSGDAQRLFIRLYQRKGPWFRVSNINYTDISNVALASDELLVAGYLTAGDDNETMDKLEVLNVPELKQLICKGQWMRKVELGTAKRDELLDCIISAAKGKHHSSVLGNCSVPAVSSMIMEAVGVSVRVSDLAAFLFWRIQRLFFLNGDQDLSAFLLVDMGRIKYPTYICKRTRCIFATRKDLLAYEKALEVAQAMDMALEDNDKKSISQLLEMACMQLVIKESRLDTDCGIDHCDVFLVRFSAAWVYATVVTLGVSILERDRKYIEAVDLLKHLLDQNCCPGRRGYWTVRLSMDLEHLGRKEESLEVAEAGLKDPRIRHGDRVALQRRVIRLGKPPRRWRKPPYADAMARRCKEVCIRGRPLNCVAGVKSRFYGYDGQQCSVEELALQFYAKEESGQWQGVHSEGGVWMTLFGLLMWDILFADVPNVFVTPFQTAPLDLDTDAFYPSREAAIEAQLLRVYTGEAAQILAETWATWYGTLCKGVNWNRHSLTELQVITSCIGGPGLASICRLLAEDHAGWTGGMPDLLLWRVLPNSNEISNVCSSCSCQRTVLPPYEYESQLWEMKLVKGEAKLVEVKGPRDHLSEQQRAWILILMDAGICIEVCKVHEQPKTDSSILF